jgi:transposase-like protein
MTKAKQSGAFKGHRFPPEIISYAVWAYFRFPMSFRDVEDLLYKRGVIISYETIRSWVGKFGHQYAKVIRRDRPAPSDKWHLDEVVITIRGKKYWLWSAVDSKRAVFVKGVVRRFHAASLISGALVSFSGFNQTGPAGCQFWVFPDQRCGFCARAVA